MTPNPRLLNLLLIFIGGTVCGAAAKPLGTPIVIVAGMLGSLAGWVAGRWLMRRLF